MQYLYFHVWKSHQSSELVIFTAYADNLYDLCTEKALHVINILVHEEWPEKYTAMAYLYSFLGNAAIGKRDYNGGLHFHGKDLEIGEKQ